MTPPRATRIVREHLLNEKEFWLAYPVASYAKTESDYYQGSHHECNWRGPTWAPTNYMIFQGLMKYGFKDEAKALSHRLAAWLKCSGTARSSPVPGFTTSSPLL
jgi:putative isomerase